MLNQAERVARVIAELKRLYPHSTYYLNFSAPLELLVASILSAQCRDETVNAVTPALFKKYKTAQAYATAPLKELQSDLKRITFYNNKAKNIQSACRILMEKYNGNVPDTMEALVELPGIARKTANVILMNAFNKVEGIAVDTHVIRLSRRLGFTTQEDPVKIERDLMGLVPRSDWKVITHLMKDHGRAVCTAPTPACSKCSLNEKKVCPRAGVKTCT